MFSWNMLFQKSPGNTIQMKTDSFISYMVSYKMTTGLSKLAGYCVFLLNMIFYSIKKNSAMCFHEI